MTSTLPLFSQDQDDPQPAPKQPTRQSSLGQFLTPEPIAAFMASLFASPFPAHVRLLDPGAGDAALTTAFVRRWQELWTAGSLEAEAHELDDHIASSLETNVAALNVINGVTVSVKHGNFVAKAALHVRQSGTPRYTHAILNPPYKKISSSSDYRYSLRFAGIETVNLYSGFVALALRLLEEGGELVAIIPRSFCNGPYYLPFRRILFSEAALLHVHLFGSRTSAFKADAVLQENIIIHLKRRGQQGDVIVSTSENETFSDYQAATYPFDRIVASHDPDLFVHLPTREERELIDGAAFANQLGDLGLSVSTGPVVDFRMRQALLPQPTSNSAPLLYPGHFKGGRLVWPREGFKKANAIAVSPSTRKWLYPGGVYTVVRRFSSKEEPRRIVANVIGPGDLPGEVIGFENHLNVFHKNKGPIAEEVARGLAVYLNSTAVDRYFRRFNGHTQVNARDLRTLPYPSLPAIEELGRWARARETLDQQQIDESIEGIA